MRCHSAAVAWLLLAGCASTPKAEPLPALVKVPVLEYVRVPDKLTAPCPVTRATSRTVEAVVSAYHAHVTALDACNAKLQGIRDIKPHHTLPKPPARTPPRSRPTHQPI